MALTVVGDKLGINAPTVGGSTDLFGAEQNSNTYPEIDEGIYAPREDRNLVVLGGGAIKWTASTGQVTFTSAINIYNHITAFKNIITTAASPLTLNTALRVGYVKMTRKPAADNSITSISVANSGALPNTSSDADHGTFVLFFQTSDNTLWVPWARKEILDGDVWQFGASQTWYERIAASRKPGYRANPSDTSQVIVPASSAAPAVVVIDGKLYANTSNATLDLDTAGRNGLDTGAKAATTPYYLYAIPAASGRTFDLVCSVTAPSGAGPTGFSSWSYIGAFSTSSGVTSIDPFYSANGQYFADNEIINVNHTGTTGQTSKTLTNLPTTAKAAWGFMTINGATAATAARVMGNNVSNNNGIYQVNVSASAANAALGYVPIFTANTIYLQLETAGNTVNFYLLGWVEDPMEFR